MVRALLLSGFIAGCGSWLALTSEAQEITSFGTPVTSGEPVGFDVVRKCVKASGGVDAFRSLKSIVMKGEITVTPQLKSSTGETKEGPSVKGTLETHFVAPDRAKVMVDLGGFGKSVRGISGSVSWETSDAGNRKLDPSERARLLDSISLRETFDPSSVFSSFTNRGRENVDGKPCYRVEVTRHGSNESDQIFFAIDTGLPARTIAQRYSVGGDRVIDSTITQYDTFAGLKLATHIRQEMEAFSTLHEVVIQSIEINAPIDASVFTPPTDLK